MPTSSELLQTIDWKGSIKVFIFLLILSMIFFTFYTIIKSDKSQKIGILPFPSSGPYVPLDSSNCGRNVIECTGDDKNGCNTKCSSTLYQCTNIGTKEVWYLGTKLGKNKSFCLPGQDQPAFNECGTYTGKAIWGIDENNKESWLCQCKYPTLFNGPACTNPVSCTINRKQLSCDPSNPLCGKLYKIDDKGDKIAWDPNTSMPPQVVDDNPLSYKQDSPEPLYTCDCNDKSGSYTKKGDPYRCHPNICHGGAVSPSIFPGAQFNSTTNECICDNTTTVKSNVTGFCYTINPDPTQSNNCQPDILTGNCTCGNKFILSDPTGGNKTLGVFFKRLLDFYITYQPTICTNNTCLIYKVLINTSTATDSKGKKILDTLNDTLIDIKGTMVEFQLMQYKTYTSIDVNSPIFTDYIKDSFPPFSIDKQISSNVLINIMQTQNERPQFVIPCDSYFFNRPTDIGCPDSGCVKCSDSWYSSSDMNNKNGTMCYSVLNGKLCGGNGSATVNPFDTEGYTCTCSAEDCIDWVPVDKPAPGNKDNKNHIVHECRKCSKCKGEACEHDSECENCHKCNYGSCGGDCTIM